jgi:hypothetical protein
LVVGGWCLAVNHQPPTTSHQSPTTNHQFNVMHVTIPAVQGIRVAVASSKEGVSRPPFVFVRRRQRMFSKFAHSIICRLRRRAGNQQQEIKNVRTSNLRRVRPAEYFLTNSGVWRLHNPEEYLSDSGIWRV